MTLVSVDWPEQGAVFWTSGAQVEQWSLRVRLPDGTPAVTVMWVRPHFTYTWQEGRDPFRIDRDRLPALVPGSIPTWAPHHLYAGGPQEGLHRFPETASPTLEEAQVAAMQEGAGADSRGSSLTPPATAREAQWQQQPEAEEDHHAPQEQPSYPSTSAPWDDWGNWGEGWGRWERTRLQNMEENEEETEHGATGGWSTAASTVRPERSPTDDEEEESPLPPEEGSVYV